MSRSERFALWSAFAAMLVLRAIAFFRYRFDADEQQHLHVAWGWTAGLIPYRDTFDNHAPLFHLVTAPLLALFGERSDILFWMRLPMLLLFAATLWSTWVIAKRLWDERVALYAIVLLALFPPFFLKSLEFRTDNLWNALWMLAAVTIAGRSLTRRRALLFGLLLGCAMATSLKTSLLLFTLAAAAAITWFFALRGRTPRPSLHVPWMLAGFAVVPLLLLVFFAASGAWDAMIYCTVTFNGNLSLTRSTLWIGRAIFPFSSAALLWCCWRWRSAERPWRYFFAVATGVYSVTLAGFWILISPRDLLPLMPFAAMFAAAFLTRKAKPLRWLAAATAISLAALWYYAEGFVNRTAWHTTMLDQALRLTRPGEKIIDVKGETIFRERPFYYALEYISRAQLAHGLIRDTIPEDVVRTRTYVAQADGPMWPPRGRAFLSDNFLNLGRLRAAGQWIREDGSFSIAIPGEYIVLDDAGPATGQLDGTAASGPRTLSAGPHRFSRALPGGPLAVLWAPAWQRGHSPYHLRDLEF